MISQCLSQTNGALAEWMYMRRSETPEIVVQFHGAPQVDEKKKYDSDNYREKNEKALEIVIRVYCNWLTTQTPNLWMRVRILQPVLVDKI